MSDEMTSTSEVEVTQISKHGIWLLIQEKEHFLSAIHNVKLLNEHHLYWPDLDVDVAVESIAQPEEFPLVAR